MKTSKIKVKISFRNKACMYAAAIIAYVGLNVPRFLFKVEMV